MPYISGNKFNFESRLHQLCWDVDSFDKFVIEKNSYVSNTSSFLVDRWNKEIIKKKIILSILFRPSELGGGLALWLDASDASTLYDATTGGSLVAPDGAVARWEDKSGNGRRATQGTLNNRPLFKTGGTGGKSYVNLDGFDDEMNFTSFVAGTSYSVFSVVKKNSTLFRGFIGGGSGELNPWIGYNATNYAHYDGSTFYNRPSANLGPIILGFIQDGSTSRGFSFNGDYATSTSAGRSASFNNIGNPATTYMWDGDIYEIIVATTALTENQRSQINSYFASKYAIALA